MSPVFITQLIRIEIYPEEKKRNRYDQCFAFQVAMLKLLERSLTLPPPPSIFWYISGNCVKYQLQEVLKVLINMVFFLNSMSKSLTVCL